VEPEAEAKRLREKDLDLLVEERRSAGSFATDGIRNPFHARLEA
jgi:hypothetical protein